MSPPPCIAFVPALLVAASLWAGCGHKEGGDHNHGEKEAHAKDAGDSHDEESPSGASFKEGTGVMLTDATRKILAVEVANLAERKMPNQIRFTVQVFGEKHHHLLSQDDHSGCDMHASGFLSTNSAVAVKPGQPVQLFKDTNSPLSGVVLAVQKALALGETEIVVGVSNAMEILKPGEFVAARISLARDATVAVVPQAALLRTSEGTFVYAVNGDAYIRTAVKVGAEADGWAQIIDGLLAGAQVVTQPVQTLWLIELRATKGGGHEH